MPDESELIESMAHALASRPTFDGVVIYCREKKAHPNGKIHSKWGMATPKNATATQTRKILEGVLGPIAEPSSLSTDALIAELLCRPGFRGIIAQELGHEGREVTGRTEFRSHVPSNLSLVEAIQILRTCADKLEARLPESK
jgi:hypothetical protein